MKDFNFSPDMLACFECEVEWSFHLYLDYIGGQSGQRCLIHEIRIPRGRDDSGKKTVRVKTSSTFIEKLNSKREFVPTISFVWHFEKDSSSCF